MLKSFRKQTRVFGSGDVLSVEAKEKLLLVLKVLVIIAAAQWIYLPVLHGSWLWDDNVDITQNPITQSPSGLWSIWFHPGSQIDYYPFKSTVQWVQWHLWGNDTLGYHATNLVLHLTGSLLVWRLFYRLGLSFAWLGGLLFAVHPTMVESVAWIAELKNTLSLPPFLLAVLFYLDYDEQGKRIDYLLALGLFAVAMLCKPTMVAFPFVILLYAWWKRNRIGRREILASIPFLLISLEVGINTVVVGNIYRHHAHVIMEPVPLGGFLSRLAVAGLSLAFYFSKAVLPVNLLPIYPQWPVNPPSPIQFLPWPVLIGVIYGLWLKRQSWGRHALFGLGFFLITLAPFVTINVGGYTTFTWVMDHFLYIPIIGLISLAIAALGQIQQRLSPPLRLSGAVAVAALMIVLVFQSRSYASEFVDQETLWTYTVKHRPESALAQNNLGGILVAIGRLAEGMEHLREAIRLRPDYFDAYNNLGIALAKSGASDQAIAEFQEAVRLKPEAAEAHNNLGKVFMQQNRWPEAGEQFMAVIKSDPDDAAAYVNVGNLLMQMQRTPDAIAFYEQALALEPDNARTHERLGIALANLGRLPDATEQFQLAVQLNPEDVSALDNLGQALEDSNRLPEATAQFEAVLRYDPTNARALNELSRLQGQGMPAK